MVEKTSGCCGVPAPPSRTSEGPLAPRRAGRVAHLVVAGLVAQGERHRVRPGREIGGQRELRPDGEVPVEDDQGLRQSLLLEFHRLREDHFGAADAGRRFEGEFSGDERGVARRVRLDVETLGQRHLQRGPHRGAGADAVALDQRHDLRRDALQLRACQRRHEAGHGSKSQGQGAEPHDHIDVTRSARTPAHRAQLVTPGDVWASPDRSGGRGAACIKVVPAPTALATLPAWIGAVRFVAELRDRRPLIPGPRSLFPVPQPCPTPSS